jgi:pilus assembly protein CpaB
MNWLFGNKAEAMGNLLLHLAGVTRTMEHNELRLSEAEFDAFMGEVRRRAEVHRRAKAAPDFHHATTGRAKATLKSVLRLEVWGVAAAIVVIIFGSYGPLVRLWQPMQTETDASLAGNKIAQVPDSPPLAQTSPAREWLAAHAIPPSAQNGTVVVAAAPLGFGMPLNHENVTEIPWAFGKMPEGAYATRDELFKDGRRVALAPLQRNELILKTKVTGPGQRASLSSLLDEGKRAVTVRVDDVRGVAGFVLPGDRVDVVLIRSVPGPSGATENISDVMLQHVKVLAIDQLANEQKETPTVARAVMLEVDTDQAQKILLATNVGKLSLILRQAGESNPAIAKRVTERDLARIEPVAAPAPVTVPTPPRRSESTTVTIIRNMKREMYSTLRSN